jgi:hypothetical protein
VKTRRLWQLAAYSAVLGFLAPARPASGEERFVAPAAGEVLSPGAIVDVRWTSPCSAPVERKVDEAELVLSLDGGRTFPIRVSPELKACASHFLWKVPALPAAHARLALRTGSEERDATETIEVLSADFRILSDPDGRVEQLRRRAAELWTPSDPALMTADDLLEHSVSGARHEVGNSAALPEAAMPASPSGAIRPERAATYLEAAGFGQTARAFPALARSAGAPTSLRL